MNGRLLLALAAVVTLAAGCSGSSSSPSVSTHPYTKAQALIDINSPDKKTFCRAFDWDLGDTGFMSYNMVKRQYVRAGYGTAKQFETKAEKMACH